MIVRSQSNNDEQREPGPPRHCPKCQDLETMKWTKRDNHPILHNFTGSSDIQQGDLNVDRSVSDLFACFFPIKLIDHITEESNRYANAHPLPFLQPGKQHHDSEWKDGTRDEIKVVLALCILYGYHKKIYI